MNPIEQFIRDKTGKKPSHLARRVGCSPSTITRIIRGERRPSVSFAEKVEQKTGGEIKALDFLAACVRSAA